MAPLLRCNYCGNLILSGENRGEQNSFVIGAMRQRKAVERVAASLAICNPSPRNLELIHAGHVIGRADQGIRRDFDAEQTDCGRDRTIALGLAMPTTGTMAFGHGRGAEGGFHGSEGFHGFGGGHLGNAGVHGGFGGYRGFPGYFGYGGYGLGLGGHGLGAYGGYEGH